MLNVLFLPQWAILVIRFTVKTYKISCVDLKESVSGELFECNPCYIREKEGKVTFFTNVTIDISWLFVSHVGLPGWLGWRMRMPLTRSVWHLRTTARTLCTWGTTSTRLSWRRFRHDLDENTSKLFSPGEDIADKYLKALFSMWGHS